MTLLARNDAVGASLAFRPRECHQIAVDQHLTAIRCTLCGPIQEDHANVRRGVMASGIYGARTFGCYRIWEANSWIIGPFIHILRHAGWIGTLPRLDLRTALALS